MIKKQFRVHTSELLNEIFDHALPRNNGMLFVPINVFRLLLIQVANRARELNDTKLNLLMCRLTLYDQADPSSKDYISTIIEDLEEELKNES